MRCTEAIGYTGRVGLEYNTRDVSASAMRGEPSLGQLRPAPRQLGNRTASPRDAIAAPGAAGRARGGGGAPLKSMPPPRRAVSSREPRRAAPRAANAAPRGPPPTTHLAGGVGVGSLRWQHGLVACRRARSSCGGGWRVLGLAGVMASAGVATSPMTGQLQGGLACALPVVKGNIFVHTPWRPGS